MNIEQQIQSYIDSQGGSRRTDMLELHTRILNQFPGLRLWYLDGKDGNDRIVSNPNIGYGSQTMKYANGKTKEFYRVGLSANTTGISVYIMSIADKNYLKETYEKKIGKANVSGYCIKFKTVKDIHLDTLEEAIAYGLLQSK